MTRGRTVRGPHDWVRGIAAALALAGALGACGKYGPPQPHPPPPLASEEESEEEGPQP